MTAEAAVATYSVPPPPFPDPCATPTPGRLRTPRSTPQPAPKSRACHRAKFRADPESSLRSLLRLCRASPLLVGFAPPAPGRKRSGSGWHLLQTAQTPQTAPPDARFTRAPIPLGNAFSASATAMPPSAQSWVESTKPLLNQLDHSLLQRGFLLQIKFRRISPERAQNFLGVFRGAEFGLCIGDIARFPGAQ